MYKPKIVKGKVQGTGYPIDGHIMYFSLWDYDNQGSYHLLDWEQKDDEDVMITMYQSEEEAGLCIYDSLEEFKEAWDSGRYEPDGVFWLGLDKVEVIEVLQEEQLE